MSRYSSKEDMQINPKYMKGTVHNKSPGKCKLKLQ